MLWQLTKFNSQIRKKMFSSFSYVLQLIQDYRNLCINELEEKYLSTDNFLKYIHLPILGRLLGKSNISWWALFSINLKYTFIAESYLYIVLYEWLLFKLTYLSEQKIKKRITHKKSEINAIEQVTNVEPLFR